MTLMMSLSYLGVLVLLPSPILTLCKHLDPFVHS